MYMQLKIKIYYIIGAIIICTFFASCKKFVETQIPKNQLTTSAVFEDSANATSAVLGIYIDVMQTRTFTTLNGGIPVSTGLTSDELSTSLTLAEINEMLNNSITINNSLNAALWKYAYTYIYEINACIEGLSNSSSITILTKNSLIGECKLLRAFIYFNLVNLYGGVPLVTSTDYRINESLPRSSSDEVYNLIIEDLNYSKANLSIAYVTPNRHRPNQYTAMALLAKVYLYQKKWALAETESNQIIASGVYSLDRNLTNVFVEGSSEVLWALQPVLTTIQTYEGNTFIPSSSSRIPSYPLTDTLANSFESGDQRKASWTKFNTVSGRKYYYPFKYQVRTTGTRTENYIITRLADVILIRAESKAQQNKLSEAIADIDTIRNRAGLASLPSSLNQNQVMAAIQQERRVELFCEWGNRWFDLKRWEKADTVLTPIKGTNWQSTDVLFAIPQGEINNNHFLTQNPGY